MTRIVTVLSMAGLLVAGTAAAQEQRTPTRTIENLRHAVADEANAANRYARFAARADEEGHTQVAELFRAAAESERIHRRNHEAVLRALGQQVPEPRIADVHVGSTRENLRVPIEGEQREAAETYPRYIEEARREGVPAAVTTFTYAREAEQGHERLFREAFASLDGQAPEVDYYVQSESGVLEARPGNVQAVTTVPTRAPTRAQRAG